MIHPSLPSFSNVHRGFLEAVNNRGGTASVRTDQELKDKAIGYHARQ